MGNVTLDRRNLHAGPRLGEETPAADSGLRNCGFSGWLKDEPDWIALQNNAGIAAGSGGSPDEPVWTPFNGGALTNRRLPFPQTLVFSLGAVSGIIPLPGVSYRVKVEGFDQFGQPVTEITPVLTTPIYTGGAGGVDTINFYLSQVFSYVKALYFWEGPNPFTIGTVVYGVGILNEWLYTDTTGGTNTTQHVHPENHGLGLPLRVQGIGSTAGDVFEDMGVFGLTLTRINGTQQIGVPRDNHIEVAPSNDTAKPTLKIWNDASGGDFTLSYGGATTGPILYNETAANLKTAIQGLGGGVASVDVSGAGTLANPWVVTMLTAGAVAAGLTGDGSGLTGATVGLTIQTLNTMNWIGELDKFRFTAAAVAGAGSTTCAIPIMGSTIWGTWTNADLVLVSGNAHATKGALRGTVS